MLPPCRLSTATNHLGVQVLKPFSSPSWRNSCMCLVLGLVSATLGVQGRGFFSTFSLWMGILMP